MNSELILEVNADVIEQLYHISNSTNVEDCGVFTGSLTQTGIYRINRISPSCSLKDSKSPHMCVRDANIANEFIKQDYEASNQTRVYIGEWHTHPEENPTPSALDRTSIIDIFKNSTLPFKFLFFAIVGYKSIYWGCYDGHKIFRLTNIVQVWKCIKILYVSFISLH